MALEAEWECSICYQLLLDPVVGKCGHDFCKDCLLAWASSQEQGVSGGGAKSVSCPLCRNELAPSVEGVKKLGVCVRLKQMIENLYPEKVAMRRRERQHQEELKGVAAQRSRAQQTIREGRSRYLRARRTRAVPIQPSNTAQSPSTPPPALATNLGLQQLANSIHVTFMTLPNTANSPAAGGADRQGGIPSSAGPSGTGTSWTPFWSVPHTANFTMGWFEPIKDPRRKRAARVRGGAGAQTRSFPLFTAVHT